MVELTQPDTGADATQGPQGQNHRLVCTITHFLTLTCHPHLPPSPTLVTPFCVLCVEPQVAKYMNLIFMAEIGTFQDMLTQLRLVRAKRFEGVGVRVRV